jgi:UDP-N-acetylmuramate--alanine ligase
MDLLAVKKIYFLGIGGIGMSALARYFLWQGKEISGYDRTATPLTRELENEGAIVNYTDSAESIPEGIGLVIYTPAIPADSKQLMHLQNSGVPMIKRAQILGMVAQDKPLIAVAGTHGKTTVTTLLAHIFKTSGVEFMAFLGGISTNYHANFIHTNNPHWVIVEADEYDRSFLQLHPDITIITSMDPDHLDVYGSVDHLEESFRLFIGNMKSNGRLITHNKVEKLFNALAGQQYYGLTGHPDFAAAGIEVREGAYEADYIHGNASTHIRFGWAGRHNLENALAATAAAINAGISWNVIQEALAGFKGVKRRFEIILQNDQVVYIDDYAHHPQEIRTCIHSALEMFPGRKIACIFQPHLFSRTRDFQTEFGEALDLLPVVAVMDIYPARELPIAGITALSILDNIHNARKYHVRDEEVLDFVARKEFDVLITMGAGNIDRFVNPIKEKLQS